MTEASIAAQAVLDRVVQHGGSYNVTTTISKDDDHTASFEMVDYHDNRFRVTVEELVTPGTGDVRRDITDVFRSDAAMRAFGVQRGEPSE